MPATAKCASDMIETYVDRNGRGKMKPALRNMEYEIEIVSGMAIIRQKREFANTENFPIEALMTFPVGFDAVVSEVIVEVNGKKFKGKAKAKAMARREYEVALDDGKRTVLHEELLKGLHMLSVGNILPGDKLVVTATSLMPISLLESTGMLRIPLTIGSIYGDSPLVESDDIAYGGPSIDCKVSLRYDGEAFLNGKKAADLTHVSNRDAISVELPEMKFEKIYETVQGGASVSIEFHKASTLASDVNVNFLIDESGSMSEPLSRKPGGFRSLAAGLTASVYGREESKWNAVVHSLEKVVRSAQEGDEFGYWTFANQMSAHGRSRGNNLATLHNMVHQGGGTEIGKAVSELARSCPESDVILVTDGRSHRLWDVDLVKSSGCRFMVVLVGGDAFDVNVGHLASMTGGRMFVVANKRELDAAIMTAINSARLPRPSRGAELNVNTDFQTSVGGADIVVSYSNGYACSGREVRGVSALATALALQHLSEKDAAEQAEKAGIVSRLTSIIMVDETGEPTNDIAVTQKIGLPDSGYGQIMASSAGQTLRACMSFADDSLPVASLAPQMSNRSILVGKPALARRTGSLAGDFADAIGGASHDVFRRRLKGNDVLTDLHNIHAVIDLSDYSYQIQTIDWATLAVSMNGGQFGDKRDFTTLLVLAVADRKAVKALSVSTGIDAVRISIGIVASVFGGTDRTASRLAKAVQKEIPVLKLESIGRRV